MSYIFIIPNSVDHVHALLSHHKSYHIATLAWQKKAHTASCPNLCAGFAIGGAAFPATPRLLYDLSWLS